ncbi:MAG: hypothetical protein WC496_04265 [Phycisphaerae bacterium]|jgi:hypothetical protein
MGIMLVNITDTFLLQVAKQLRTKNLHIDFIIGLGINKEDFEGTPVLNYMDLMCPEYYAQANISSPYALSAAMIEQFGECENIFLSNSDRLAFFNISVRKRKIIYYDILLYWHTFFKMHQIDCIFFVSTPHMGWDIVLYFVAGSLGIKTYCLERTGIDDTVFLVEDYTKTEKVPSDYLKDKTKDEIVALLNGDLYEKVFKTSYWIKQPFAPGLQEMSSGKLTKRFLASVKNNLNFLKKILTVGNYFEQQFSTAFSLNFPVRNLFFKLIAKIKRVRDKNLYKYYTKLSRKADLEDKYVFFPLHFQPERSSIPLGGVFENQLLALQILSRSTQADWKIYVKEHPRQLKSPRINCLHYRNKEYYETIKAIPKVVIIDIEQDTKELIKNAQVTATLTGSAGWESILSGKGCVVFGGPWYKECRSCYFVNSVEICKQAIEQILRKTKSDVEMDLLKFLSYSQHKFIVSSNSDYFATKSEKSYERLVNNLADAIISSVVNGTNCRKTK